MTCETCGFFLSQRWTNLKAAKNRIIIGMERLTRPPHTVLIFCSPFRLKLGTY